MISNCVGPLTRGYEGNSHGLVPHGKIVDATTRWKTRAWNTHLQSVKASGEGILPQRSRISQRKSALVWIRRDLFEEKSFTIEDCFPAGGGHLPKAKQFRFSEEWSSDSGRESYLKVLMEGGRGDGGRYGPGRG